MAFPWSTRSGQERGIAEIVWEEPVVFVPRVNGGITKMVAKITYRRLLFDGLRHQNLSLYKAHEKTPAFARGAIPTAFLPLFRDDWDNRLPPMINTFLQPSKHSKGRWPLLVPDVFHDPSCHQQLPQRVSEPRRWSVRPITFNDFTNNGHTFSGIVEWMTPR